MDSAGQALRKLGEVQEMNALAATGFASHGRMKANSHVHLPPNFSAFQSVEQAVDLAASEGIGVLGASNYYHYGVYADFAAHSRKRNVFPLFGLEIIALVDELCQQDVRVNDPVNPGKMYICGKGITRFEEMSREARELIGIIRRNDSRRMAQMMKRMSHIFASRGVKTGMDEDAVIDMVVRRHGCPRQWVCLQERHVAQAFQEALFRLVEEDERTQRLSRIFDAPSSAAPDDAVQVQGEIRSHLMKVGKPAYVRESFVGFAQAYRLILALGGIPCYPTLADGAKTVCEYEQDVEKLIHHIKGGNIHCAEFIPVRNTPDVLARYVKAMRQSGLVVTAGTEHNTLDALAIEPTCVGGDPVPEEIQDIFWEGACVVAGHQFLTLHGRCGFVDRQGHPNPAYETGERRIEAFRALGAAVIRRYRESNGE
jgi:hypothetical protein